MKILIVGICILFLLLSLISGLLVLKYKKDFKKTTIFINSSSLVFFILLIIFYFFPNCVSLLSTEYNAVQCYAHLFLMIILGIIILKIIMYFVSNKSDNVKNRLNISIVSLLIVFVEAIYIHSVKNNINDLLFLTIRYIAYNSLLSLSIFLSYKKSQVNINYYTRIISIFIMVLIISFLLSFKSNFIFKDNLLFGSLIGIIIGMIIYLVIYVYLPCFKQDNEPKIKTIAIIFASVIMVIVNLL